jgi:hypothetical protein
MLEAWNTLGADKLMIAEMRQAAFRAGAGVVTKIVE